MTQPAPRIGPYRLGPLLGRGATGPVHRAIDKRTGRAVAVKSLLPTRGLTTAARERFRAVWSALGAVRHPAVAGVVELLESDGLDHVVLELAEGVPASSLLGTPHAPERVVRIGLGIAAGLNALHRNGIVHGDLAPPNVLVRGDGAVVLLDPSTAIHRPGTVIGRPAWVAPELARGRPPSAPADLFALGLLLHRLLTGRMPARGRSWLETLERAASDEPPPLPPAVPAPLARLVRRLLHREPDGRPSAAAAARELSRFPRR